MYLQSKKRSWLLPALLILFLLEILLFPFAMELTYGGKEEGPNHILTYTTGKLTWDEDTQVGQDGVAEFSLFHSQYENVAGQDGAALVAPGTGDYNVVRLKNQEDYAIDYVAVLYRVRQEETLPVVPEFLGEGFQQAETYPLPQGVEADQVMGAVTGSVGGGQIQDFVLAWNWDFYESDIRDQMDTALGNQAAYAEPASVKVGVYILVQEDGHYLNPQIPQTGDNGHMAMYAGMVVISGIVLLLLLLERRKETR